MNMEINGAILNEEILAILRDLQEDTELPLELIGALDDACRSMVAHPIGLTHDQMISSFLLLQDLRKNIKTLSNFKF
ncbi:MAG: hypothetical protein HDS25_01105 [Bacteroides sp.]|nr:hypothetical protein [Bacteroides sp.]MBD5294904.1 hypothetical protein [Bacteroides sp.]